MPVFCVITHEDAAGSPATQMCRGKCPAQGLCADLKSALSLVAHEVHVQPMRCAGCLDGAALNGSQVPVCVDIMSIMDSSASFCKT